MAKSQQAAAFSALLALNSADPQEPCDWRLPHRSTQVSSFIKLTHLPHRAFCEGRRVPCELFVLTTHSLPFLRANEAIAGDEALLKELEPAAAPVTRKAQAKKAAGAGQVVVQTAGKHLHRAIARRMLQQIETESRGI